MKTLDAEYVKNARELAEGMSELLTAKEQALANEHASSVVEGLREICESDASASKVAAAFTKLLALLQCQPLQYAGESIDHTIAAYALAAGNLAGVYDLPEVTDPAPKANPSPAPEPAGMYL
jgi:hypothetical protein